MDTLGLIISLILTLMVFSYILNDNPLFKLAEHIFVGVSAGYAVLIIIYMVIMPAFFSIQLNNGTISSVNLLTKLPPILFCILLFLKIIPTQSKIISMLGSITLAFLVGVGAAVAIGGALLGTLYPQTLAVASINLSPSNPAYADSPIFLLHNEFLSNIIIIIGTIGTLFYFTFAQRQQGVAKGLREGIVSFWAGMGRWVILITMGALFANTVSARIALLASRIQFVVQGFQQLGGS